MKVSLNCLSKFVDINDLKAEEIANKLTFSGVEVENISYLASGTNLIIGHVLKDEKHPDSDHLHVLQVDLGKEEGIKQIVCGAPNARVGLKVIVAMVGAILPGGEIKKAKVRGVESDGMCCSLLELGVDAKYLSDYQLSGIEELPSDAPVGEKDVLGYLGLDDAILDMKVLANRPDLLGLINIAREIGAIFNRKVNIPSFNSEVDFISNFKVGSQTDKCSQFSAIELKELVNSDSPNWMKKALMAMGVRSINALVDIGNYVMLVTGQPLHMYDLDKLPKTELIAKDDYEGEFVALDEKAYEIKKGDIVISSNNQPMCLGGVMGALSCAVTSETHNIVIEAASFDGAQVRRTSNRLGLASESSSRFVKGTNHFQSEYVLHMATQLVKDICFAKKCGDIKKYQKETKNNKVVSSSIEEINSRLGTNFSSDETFDVLKRLNFVIKDLADERFDAIVPDYRLDIMGSADLSEEVIRILGIDNIKSKLPDLELTVGKMNDHLKKSRLISEFLLSNNLDQCLTYTLISKNELSEFNYLCSAEAYKIINPLTDEHEYVRLNIMPSLLKTLSYNVSRQQKDVRLFEISDLISIEGKSIHLAIALSGNEPIRHSLNTRPVDFYSVKGLFEGIMDIFGIEGNRYKIERLTSDKNELHPGKSAIIKIGNEVVGYLGELHPSELDRRDLGIKNTVSVLEIKLDPFFEMRTSTVKMKEISKFPSVRRDISLLIDKEVEVKELIRLIKTVGKFLVVGADIFDVYEGKNIDNDKKSIAISIEYQASDHTLKDNEVNEVETKIKNELIKKFSASLRM
jgi:phenylalanyl-tRNA synthetase beta chain